MVSTAHSGVSLTEQGIQTVREQRRLTTTLDGGTHTMLSRKQQYRRLRMGGSRRPADMPKAPLSLFATGQELAMPFSSAPVLWKSNSHGHESSTSLAAAAAAPLRRSVSDSFYSPARRTLFGQQQQPARPATPLQSAMLPAASPLMATAVTVEAARVKGRVAFRPQVFVRLIPKASTMTATERDLIYYSRSELAGFQRELVSRLPKGTSLKQTVLVLGGILTTLEVDAADQPALATAAVVTLHGDNGGGSPDSGDSKGDSSKAQTSTSSVASAHKAATSLSSATSHVHKCVDEDIKMAAAAGLPFACCVTAAAASLTATACMPATHMALTA